MDNHGHVLGKSLAQTGVDLVQRRRPVIFSISTTPSKHKVSFDLQY
jgi:hypothetical protein